MKRIFSLLAVTALMVAMLLTSAMPAFAAPSNGGAPKCDFGTTNAELFSKGRDNRDPQATRSISDVFFEKCLQE